jgi:thioredoxin reductase (NADPH)
MESAHDVVIIGGGPAGLTAGIYAARSRLDVILLEKTACGGQILIADRIENFPGFPEGIKGPDLAEQIIEQGGRFGLKTRIAEANGIILKTEGMRFFVIKLADGTSISALSLIIAAGARWNDLGVRGEKELAGRGVSYCAVCDGPLFKGKDVMVVGGGDTAVEDALFLTKFAKKVTIVHRRSGLRAARILQEKAFADKKIGFFYDSVVEEIIGENRVESVRIKNVLTGEKKTLTTSGIFILVGISPNSGLVKSLVEMDEKGYIITDDDMRTSVDGIFACGDVRKKALRQVVTATGEGAKAAFSAEAYVARIKGIEYK